tara:strand:+ start:891 stop:1202 length:312 start_codon:yes stop_codon:yes gene_type:complete
MGFDSKNRKILKDFSRNLIQKNKNNELKKNSQSLNYAIKSEKPDQLFYNLIDKSEDGTISAESLNKLKDNEKRNLSQLKNKNNLKSNMNELYIDFESLLLEEE